MRCEQRLGFSQEFKWKCLISNPCISKSLGFWTKAGSVGRLFNPPMLTKWMSIAIMNITGRAATL